MTNDKLAATFHGAEAGPPISAWDLLGIGLPDSTPTPEQALCAHVADLLTDVDHFDGCKAHRDCDICTCICLVGRLDWAINAEQVTP